MLMQKRRVVDHVGKLIKAIPSHYACIIRHSWTGSLQRISWLYYDAGNASAFDDLRQERSSLHPAHSTALQLQKLMCSCIPSIPGPFAVQLLLQPFCHSRSSGSSVHERPHVQRSVLQ